MTTELVVCGSNDSHMMLSCDEQEGPDDIVTPRRSPLGSTQVVSVALGASHALWLAADGSAYSMGCNTNGQCGFASPDQIRLPTRLDGLANSFTAVRVVAGSMHSAVVTSCGRVALFGANDNGQCGHGADAPVDVRKPKLLKSALQQPLGQLGGGPASPSSSLSLDVVDVALGDAHTLLLDVSARVYACGQGRFGALGLGGEANQPTPVHIRALIAAPVRQMACGERHSAVLTYGGAVLTFGWARHGALGAPAARGIAHSAGSAASMNVASIVPIPRLVPALRRGVQQIACGANHTLALLEDGSLFGFGRGGSGGPLADSSTPTAIPIPSRADDPVPRIAALSCGRSHSLALLSDGQALSWGGAPCGQLFFGDTVDVPTPRAVPATAAIPAGQPPQKPSAKRVVAIAAGGHSSALLLDDEAGAASCPPGGNSSGARRPATLSLSLVRNLADAADWQGLASIVGGVFGSAGLCNASFAHEAATGGGIKAHDLEAVYVAVLRAHEHAPEVLGALRDSIPALIDDLESALTAAAGGSGGVGGGGGFATPPTLSRTGSAASSSSFSGAAAAGALGMRDHGFIVSPLVALLHNPLLSHASEAASLHRLAHFIDARLSAEARHRLVAILASQPADIFAARFVRPLQRALERAFISWRQGGEVGLHTVAVLVRLLGLGYDANEHAKAHRQAQKQTAGAAVGAVGAAAGAADEPSGSSAHEPGSLPTTEFYNAYISEHLDYQRDFVDWINGGVVRRSEPGTDPRGGESGGFTFCSEPWLLNPQAKARLLQVEASVKMGGAQKQAVMSTVLRQARRGGGGDSPSRGSSVLLPSKRRRRALRGPREVDGQSTSEAERARAAAGGGGGGGGVDDDEGGGPPPPPSPNSPYLILRVRRSHLVADTLDVLAEQTAQSLLRPLKVIFEGEPAIDEGGVAKEFFQLLVEQIFSPDFGMFDWSEEARCFWFSRASASLEAEAEFLLVGLVIGLAIHNGVILDLHFPPLLWKRLLNEPVGLAELPQVAPDLARGLASLLTFDGEVESTFLADFSIATEAFGAMAISELKPGGAEIAVTNANREEYAALYAEHLLVNSVEGQFSAFMQGFLLLCDGMGLSLLSPPELEQLVCGVPHLDFRALEANAQYDAGFDASHPTVRLFWEVLHSLGTEDQKKLLFFATGCDRAPLGGLGKLRFILQRGGDDSMDLPTSHTCFNMLTLPEYKSRAKMRDRLTIAIRNATGFGLQ